MIQPNVSTIHWDGGLLSMWAAKRMFFSWWKHPQKGMLIVLIESNQIQVQRDVYAMFTIQGPKKTSHYMVYTIINGWQWYTIMIHYIHSIITITGPESFWNWLFGDSNRRSLFDVHPCWWASTILEIPDDCGDWRQFNQQHPTTIHSCRQSSGNSAQKMDSIGPCVDMLRKIYPYSYWPEIHPNPQKYLLAIPFNL